MLTLDCVTFCERVISATREWLATKAEQVNVIIYKISFGYALWAFCSQC